MTLSDAMVRLEALGNEKVRAMNTRNGVVENQFGVKMGDIRSLAKEIKMDTTLAKELWQTENLEARLLSTLITKPKHLSIDEIESMVASIVFDPVAPISQLSDWVMSYIVKLHPQKEERRLAWMESDNFGLGRAGWSLTAEQIVKNPEGVNANELLDRIENEMPEAPRFKQWTMNYCLAEIGINFPNLRDRAIEIGNKIGAFADWPVSKGCTSPFAPIWITEISSRRK